MIIRSGYLDCVRKIKYGDAIGSSLYVQTAKSVALVTAAHILVGAAAGDNVAVFRNSRWELVGIARIDRCPNGGDVCIVVLTNRMGAAVPRELVSTNLNYGQDVLYCGFPLGIETIGLSDSIYPLPVVKRGIFSGIRRCTNGTEMLFDTVNNRGFSGGPIFAKSHQDESILVASVVSGYLYDADLPVLVRDGDGTAQEHPNAYVRPNSGFMRGTGMTWVAETLALI